MRDLNCPCRDAGRMGGEIRSPRRIRQSNMELLRLLSMFFVLALHANATAIEVPTADDIQAAPLPSFTRIFLEQATVVAVDVFVLISGWFGIRPTLKGAGNFAFQVAFYAVALAVCAAVFRPGLVDMREVGYMLCFGACWWFVPSYAILYMMAKPLNTFVEHSDKRTLGIFVVVFFMAQLMFDRSPLLFYSQGYSPWSFIGLYLLARYLRLYASRWTGHRARNYFAGYFLLVVSASLIGFLPPLLGFKSFSAGHLQYSYNSPLVILESVMLLLAFARLEFSSKVVNTLAASCFAIYLIHASPLLWPYFLSFFRDIYGTFSGVVYLMVVFAVLVGTALACILIDRVRLVAWRWFQSRAGKWRQVR